MVVFVVLLKIGKLGFLGCDRMDMWIIIVVVAVVIFILVAYFVMGRLKKDTYRNAIDELEIQKYELSNKPVMFELAKLKSVRKSERIIKLVAEWEKRWQDLEEQLITVEDNIAYAEESIASGEFERADEIVDATQSDLNELFTKVDAFLAEIENLKTSELRNRDGIVKLRELSTSLNEKYTKNKPTYEDVSPQIERVFKEVEGLFTKFDVHMEASNYDLADEIGDKVQDKLNLVKKAFDKVPLYRESIEIDINPMLEGILDSNSAMLEDGMFLGHLKIEPSVMRFKKELDSIPNLLQNFEFEEIEKLLVEIPSEAKKLRDAMKHELDVKETFEQDLAQLKIDSAFVVKECDSLNERYDAIKESCLMRSDDDDNFRALSHEIGIVNIGVNNLIAEIELRDKAISNMHTSVLGYLTQLGEIAEQLRIFEEEIAELYEGSKDVKGQAIQLLHEVNELKAEFEKASFDKNVSRFKVILDKADNQIAELLKETSRIPIDVASVKSSLKVTNEVITKAKKEIALSIEQLKMAERLLVYGNRYIEREGMYLMDLTIAEDQFHQGYYESVIDKMYKILADVEGNAFFKVFENLKQELGCSVI